MIKDFVFEEITSAVISTVTGALLEQSSRFAIQKIRKQILIKKSRKREAYLKEKYKDRFELLREMDQGSLFEWLKETNTIKRILSFSNADDICNISTNQMQQWKECFFIDAFHKAQIHDHDWSAKVELQKILNELFQYVDELFWKISDEKDVFLYKNCVSEIKNSLREFAEDIKQDFHYHDSFAEYIDNQKVLQDVPYKLDYRSGEIPFVGRTEELEEIDAFCASDAKISWWAVIGKGGSGKSRLAYHYIEKNINSLDWKMCFLNDNFFKQSQEGGKYTRWITWTYHKNLLLVVDYVQKYAEELAQWIDELRTNKSVSKKIRILLLERTGSEESLWYKEKFDKREVASCKYEKDFLKLQSKDTDLIQFAGKYAEKSKKQISEADAMDALAKLKTIDPEARILYFIMILEAIFNGKNWRSWNRVDLADYIVGREQKNIDVRFEDNQNMIRSYNILLAFCTATKGLSFFEKPRILPELIKKEIEKILNNAYNKKSYTKDQLCALLQLENDVLQPVTPDIIGEYMVLHIIKKYFFTRKDKEQFIEGLWAHDSDNFRFFIYRLFEDKMYEQFYDDIMNLIRFDVVPHNIYVIENYSKLICSLASIGDLDQIVTYKKILEKIYRNYSHNKVIASSYVMGLGNLLLKQEPPERKATIKKLEYFSKKHPNNTKIQTVYANGLCTLIIKQTEETIDKIKKLEQFSETDDNAQITNVLLPLRSILKQSEINEAIEKLEQFAREHTNNSDIQTAYAHTLSCLVIIQNPPEIKRTIEKLAQLSINHADNLSIHTTYAHGLYLLSFMQELPERKETVETLEQLAMEHTDIPAIQTAYASGLTNLSGKQKLPEIKETVEKLKLLSKQYTNNPEIQAAYADGLSDLSCELEPPERTEILGWLEDLANAHTNNPEIQACYAITLANLSREQELPEIKQTTKKLKQLVEKYTNNSEIQEAYARGLLVLSCEQTLPQLKETIEKLEQLAKEHSDNVQIRMDYSNGLFRLSYLQELPEIKESIKKLKILAKENVNNTNIQTAYAKGLVNLSRSLELPEKNEIIDILEELELTVSEHADNTEIQSAYALGLVNLIHWQEPSEREKSIEKLEQLIQKHPDDIEIQAMYAMGLANLCSKQTPEKNKEIVNQLEHLSSVHADNSEFQAAYATGLSYLSYGVNPPEKKAAIEKLELLSRQHADNEVIQAIYAKTVHDA